MAAPFTRTKGLPPRIRNPQSEFRNRPASAFTATLTAVRASLKWPRAARGFLISRP